MDMNVVPFAKDLDLSRIILVHLEWLKVFHVVKQMWFLQLTRYF